MIDLYAGPARTSDLHGRRAHFDTFRDFAAALLIGTLIGIEREQHKQSEGDRSVGGLRTFMLLAMLGAIGGWLAQLLDSRGFSSRRSSRRWSP